MAETLPSTSAISLTDEAKPGFDKLATNISLRVLPPPEPGYVWRMEQLGTWYQERVSQPDNGQVSVTELDSHL